MPVRIDDAWSYHGLKVVRLENEILALDVLPERGGNIFRLVDKPRDLDLLWKSPRVVPHLAAIHAGKLDLTLAPLISAWGRRPAEHPPALG